MRQTFEVVSTYFISAWELEKPCQRAKEPSSYNRCTQNLTFFVSSAVATSVARQLFVPISQLLSGKNKQKLPSASFQIGQKTSPDERVAAQVKANVLFWPMTNCAFVPAIRIWQIVGGTCVLSVRRMYELVFNVVNVNEKNKKGGIFIK